MVALITSTIVYTQWLFLNTHTLLPLAVHCQRHSIFIDLQKTGAPQGSVMETLSFSRQNIPSCRFAATKISRSAPIKKYLQVLIFNRPSILPFSNLILLQTQKQLTNLEFSYQHLLLIRPHSDNPNEIIRNPPNICHSGICFHQELSTGGKEIEGFPDRISAVGFVSSSIIEISAARALLTHINVACVWGHQILIRSIWLAEALCFWWRLLINWASSGET